MSSKPVQWIVWLLAMTVFTLLSLAGRWLDLALAMTLAAVMWYGIVPEAIQDDNSRRRGKVR